MAEILFSFIIVISNQEISLFMGIIFPYASRRKGVQKQGSGFGQKLWVTTGLNPYAAGG